MKETKKTTEKTNGNNGYVKLVDRGVVLSNSIKDMTTELDAIKTNLKNTAKIKETHVLVGVSGVATFKDSTKNDLDDFDKFFDSYIMEGFSSDVPKGVVEEITKNIKNKLRDIFKLGMTEFKKKVGSTDLGVYGIKTESLPYNTISFSKK